MLRALDLIRRLLRHLGRIGPIILAREHVHRTRVRVDTCHARAAVPAAEVEIEVTMEDLVGDVLAKGYLEERVLTYAVGLTAIKVPDELLVRQGCGW